MSCVFPVPFVTSLPIPFPVPLRISYVFLGFVLQPFYFGNKVTCFSCAKRWIATQTLEKHRTSAKGLGTGIGRELGWTNETGKTQGFPLRHREVGNREKRERPHMQHLPARRQHLLHFGVTN
jgi:hypothetical protein